MDDIRAFWGEHNFELRVAWVRKEYDSEDDSETLQLAITTRQEFKIRFIRHRNRSLSQRNRRSRYDSPNRRSESRERSGSRSYSRPREYQGPRENQNGFEIRGEPRGRGRGAYRERESNYQGRGQNYQDRDQSNQERYREAQKYNPYTKQIFSQTRNPINWNRTYQEGNWNRGEGWDDNPNDDWTKRIQMLKDQMENHSDRDSTWTEDEVTQNHVVTSQPKQLAQQTQKVQQIQVQPKQQAPAQQPKKKGKKDKPPNQDDIDEQEVIRERLATFQKEKEQYGISDSENEWQQVIGEIDNNNSLTPKQAQQQLQQIIQQSIFSETAKQQQQTTSSKTQQRIVSPLPRKINTGMIRDKPSSQTQRPVTPTLKPTHRSGVKQRKKQVERELELLQASQQLQQQGNDDLNNKNVDILDIQGIAGQLTGLQPSSGAQNTGLNAWLRLKEAGTISASNRERTDPQINEGREDNADEEEDEQIDETAKIQNKDYKINVISWPPVQENLGIQPQNNQGVNQLSYMEKIIQNLLQLEYKRSLIKEKEVKYQKQKAQILLMSQARAAMLKLKQKQLPMFQKPRLRPKEAGKQLKRLNPNQGTLTMRMKRSIAPDRAGTLQSREISIEITVWNRVEERADEKGSSGDRGKDWRIDIQRERRLNGEKDQKIHISMETDRERRIHKYWILSEIQ
ncbi:MAG: hypothetical protein EZS28_034628 [Streblomastix strix]|uniref:Uncharacterized protein n=1 Tax=Streblomastix strix TaxID=222440 RepID=A0A5J4UI51_9EUKA|nr:MAG: hypothetical protein EZS28_034628 [Streblomastix strix]